MDNKETKKNKVNVEEILRRKRERNAQDKTSTRTNYKKRNKQIAVRHGQNTEDILLGEAQIDLQHQLLDEEQKAVSRFNNGYVAITDKVIAKLDAQADNEALQIQSAEDITYEATVEVIEESNVAGALPPRKSRFNQTLFASDTKKLPALASTQKAIAELDNDIEACEAELEDINISIDIAEAERLNKIKSVYSEVVNRREEKEAQLEELENELEGRRNYLHSLRDDKISNRQRVGLISEDDEEIDSDYEAKEDRDSLGSDTYIERCETTRAKGEQHHSSDVIDAVEFMDGDEPTVSHKLKGSLRRVYIALYLENKKKLLLNCMIKGLGRVLELSLVIFGWCEIYLMPVKKKLLD